MASPTGTAMRAPQLIVSLNSSITATAGVEGSLVVLSTSANDTVALPGGAQPTTPLFGFLYDSIKTDNGPAQVVVSGIWPGIAGASITAGDEVTSNGTDGKVQSVTALGGGTNAGVIGLALNSAASGERVAVRIAPYVKQG